MFAMMMMQGVVAAAAAAAVQNIKAWMVLDRIKTPGEDEMSAILIRWPDLVESRANRFSELRILFICVGIKVGGFLALLAKLGHVEHALLRIRRELR